MNIVTLTMIICAAAAPSQSFREVAADVVSSTPAPKPPYHFANADEKLLDEIQYGCFLYFWNQVGPSGLAKDRRKAPVASIAAVGFQLSSLPIGVERGWITRQQGRERAMQILQSLKNRSDNKKHGLYYHFLDLDTGGLSQTGYEVLVSTIDSSLLFAGAIPAGVYFGGEVQTLVDAMLAEANWKAFATHPDGFLCMGWRPASTDAPAGDGEFHSAYWTIASDEERIIYFLAVGAADPAHAVAPDLYCRLRRVIKQHEDDPPFAVSPYGTLFHYFFSHCWIDYARLGVDDPRRFGIDQPRVDWFENSRRATLTHRNRCIAQGTQFNTPAPDRWGLSACDGPKGYLVPKIRPNLIEKDEWGEGTVAPYAAGAAIMFTPAESMAALRAFRQLQDQSGKPLVWNDPSTGGYGLADAFNLDLSFVSDDYIGIDEGPLLVGIENARTGLIWNLFMQSATARRAVERLQLKYDQSATDGLDAGAATKPHEAAR